MTKVLGLDMSLTATGMMCPDCGPEVISTKLMGMERLEFIEHAVMSHIFTGPSRPDMVVIENYSFGSKGSAVYSIGELGGIIRFALYKEDVPFTVVPPSSLKKFATGKGNAGKDEVIAAAIRNFGFPGSNNNEADAWMLVKMAQAHYDKLDVTKYQEEALSKVEWTRIVKA